MKNCMSFAKGMGAGIVTGMAMAATVKCICTKSKKMSKRTGKAARAVSQIMDDIQELLS